MEVDRYPAPIRQLLELGEPSSPFARPKQWTDYRSMGIGPEHVPELVRMVADDRLNLADSESLEVWAPLHAVRALGRIEAIEGVEPLLAALTTAAVRQDDWMLENIPAAMGCLGPQAIPAVAAHIENESIHIDARSYAIHALKWIVEQHPAAREQVVAVLRRQLEQYERTDPELNTAVVGALVELNDTSTAAVMEQAFAADRVDPAYVGDWLDVKQDLGLDISEEEHRELQQRNRPWAGVFEPVTSPRPSGQSTADKSKSRAKRKQARKSRKQNRRRR